MNEILLFISLGIITSWIITFTVLYRIITTKLKEPEDNTIKMLQFGWLNEVFGLFAVIVLVLLNHYLFVGNYNVHFTIMMFCAGYLILSAFVYLFTLAKIDNKILIISPTIKAISAILLILHLFLK